MRLVEKESRFRGSVSYNTVVLFFTSLYFHLKVSVTTYAVMQEHIFEVYALHTCHKFKRCLYLPPNVKLK